MKVFFRYAFIAFSIIAVIILLWFSILKLVTLSQINVNPELFDSKGIEYHYKTHVVLGYFHIIPGILFLILGSYQFIPFFRNHYRKIHRLVGILFLLLSAVISITAIILALFVPYGNWLESSVTLVFGTYLLTGTYYSYHFARLKNFKEHQKWVTRVFFVALAVSTIRGFIALFTVFGNYTLKESFGISFLLAFILHFLMVEIWIRFLAKK
jgi:uncharacterized membrane protein